MRAFIAIPIPVNVSSQIELYQRELACATGSVKWVESNNYHLTLKFLGEINDQMLAAIIADMQEIALNINSYDVSFNKLGYFPNGDRIRVIWLGVNEGSAETVRLSQMIAHKMCEYGYPQEKNSSIHLTLGRVRQGLTVEREFFQAIKQIDSGLKKLRFRAEGFQLIKSTLTSKGPIYTVLRQFDFNL